MIQIKIENADQVLKYLKSLDEKFLQKALGAGLTAVAKPIKKELYQNTPVDSGRLRQSIGYRTQRNKEPGTRAIQVGFIKSKYKAKNISLEGVVAILDQGAKPHWIRPKPSNL